MNAHATALGDVADDGITRQWLAAAGHLREQVADALDLDIVALARTDAPRLSRNQLDRLQALGLEQLLGGVDHMRQAQVAGAKGGEHVLGGLDVGLLGQALEVHLRQAQARQLALEQGLAGGDVLVTGLQLEPMDDLGPGPRGGDIAQVGVQPVAARAAVLAGNDLHLLAGLQAVVQRHDAPVDLGATAVVADLGMHPVGEVQRRRALGQVDGVAVGVNT